MLECMSRMLEQFEHRYLYMYSCIRVRSNVRNSMESFVRIIFRSKKQQCARVMRRRRKILRFLASPKTELSGTVELAGFGRFWHVMASSN